MSATDEWTVVVLATETADWCASNPGRSTDDAVAAALERQRARQLVAQRKLEEEYTSQPYRVYCYKASELDNAYVVTTPMIMQMLKTLRLVVPLGAHVLSLNYRYKEEQNAKCASFMVKCARDKPYPVTHAEFRDAYDHAGDLVQLYVEHCGSFNFGPYRVRLDQIYSELPDEDDERLETMRRAISLTIGIEG